jgi:hypothetical protein
LAIPALAQCAPGVPSCIVPEATYTSNINLDGTGIPTEPLSLTLDPGVIVNSPGGNAVNAANTTNSTTPPSAAVTITANGTAAKPITINNTANPSGNNQSGLRIQSSGAATITATDTNIDVNGTNTNNGYGRLLMEPMLLLILQ